MIVGMSQPASQRIPKSASPTDSSAFTDRQASAAAEAPEAAPLRRGYFLKGVRPL